MRIVSGHIGHGRVIGDGERLINGPGRHVTANHLVEVDLEDLAQANQLVHIGGGGTGLPLAHRLTGHAEQHGEMLLGHVARIAQI